MTSTVTDQNYYGALAGISKLQVYDADFIKFRSLSLYLQLPQPREHQGLSISLVGRNLLHQKSTPNIDPESNYTNGNAQGIEYLGLPTSRTYGINLGIKF